MFPTLPANDPDPARRRAQICAARELYRFTHLYQSPALPDGIAVGAELPPREGFPPEEIVKVIAAEAKLLANHAVSDFASAVEGDSDGPTLRDIASLGKIALDHRFAFAAPAAAARRGSTSFPADVTAYKRMFSVIAQPEVVGLLDRGPEVQDRVFAYERLAGAAPVHLQGITVPRTKPFAPTAPMPNGYPPPAPPGELPATFALDDAVYRRAMGPDDSLDAAIAERRLYVADYRLFEGIPDGRWLGGAMPKYAYAPIAAYAVRRTTPERLGELVPVAIQCHQENGGTPANPVFTPRDGARWKMARSVVQCADGQLQEVFYHLGRTHMVMEAVVLSAHRTLSAWHPLMVLLTPHFESTMTINDHAVHSLIAPGGAVEEVFGKTLAGSLEVATRGLAETRLLDIAPLRDIGRRLVGDRDALVDYPWRDDAIELWPAMERFVRRYCELYYASSADVVGDPELRAFVETLGSGEGGNLRGVTMPTDLDSLTALIATIVWTASAQHACLNYAQFPLMGYVVNVPASLYAPAPTATTPDEEAQWTAMLPPSHLAWAQFSTLYELSAVRMTKLGEYPTLHFLDRRVETLLADYQAELERIDTFITGVDDTRLLSYPFLRPSQIGQSIFI